ncbi:MAG: hypothetical protein HKN45_12480, partial [Flavobacteriales bacterium]|nr:hypothetical protein [Flavobacteriales bacterium]
LYIICCAGFSSCTDSDFNVVTHDIASIYHQDLIVEERAIRDESIQFWENKLNDNKSNIVYLKKLASLYAERFRVRGEITDLKSSNEILESLADDYPEDVSILHQMAANLISMHQFKDAELYIQKALAVGENKYASTLLQIDIMLEIGLFEEAREVLEALNDKGRFDEQIRWVKLLDAEGDLDHAIEMMEAALHSARSMNNPELITWSLSNLADMYGHQGQIQKSYNTHLKALSNDPSAIHSIKAIGWIAYSHDKDLEKAKSIWSGLYELDHSPALELLLAEIYEFQGDARMAKKLRDHAEDRIKNAEYGNMYGSQIIELTLSKRPDIAHKIATKDLSQRQHPTSYSYMALTESQKGNHQKAETLIKNHVLNRTSEPMAIYNAAVVLQQAQNEKLAKELFTDCIDASFELGPSISKDVQKRLGSL